MAGNAIGAIKNAAGRLGITAEAYLDLLEEGLKWCSACKAWHPRSQFQVDLHRGDGLTTTCKAVRNQRPHPRRNREKDRARSLIAARVARGTIPHPNSLPCSDCRSLWSEGKPRHEYDHANGYGGEAAGQVEAVCQPCHFARGRARGEWRRERVG